MSTNRFSGRTYVTMSPELQQQIRELAEKKQMTQAVLIRQALLEYVERESDKQKPSA